ncbi:hypothetical protein DFJ58DRAFT_800427 [Suillus subalutaceus]|uniref:uncharacterized protein n=1 Tax=Suillus subalutaceus TaxID=48586 RepID=UPI001B866F66|nr:uncharacterized protein DFJ58DRAFT_800427 [Suillus subalutaceus]KAG1845685.1 hypothetical protein DFJ58DRAFT_800427 [Suillus subalutaceus]
MVDWNDPDLEAKLEVVSVQLLYAILGLYGWEYIRSSHVEIALLRRQLPFRWPLLSYITARFSFLIAVILHATQSSPFYTSVYCQSEYFFWTNVAVCCSTTNLMIRTWLIWKTSRVLRCLLVLLSLGHWTVLTLLLATARASTQNGVCVTHFVNPAYANVLVIYSTHFAFMISGYVMMMPLPSSSPLWKTLMKQGVIYFIFNFLANLILLVLNRLNLNLIMNVIFGTPAACIWSGLSLRLPHDCI